MDNYDVIIEFESGAPDTFQMDADNAIDALANLMAIIASRHQNKVIVGISCNLL